MKEIENFKPLSLKTFLKLREETPDQHNYDSFYEENYIRSTNPFQTFLYEYQNYTKTNTNPFFEQMCHFMVNQNIKDSVFFLNTFADASYIKLLVVTSFKMTHLVSYRWSGDKLEALKLYDNNGKVVSDLVVSTTSRKKDYLFYRFECTTPKCIIKVQTLIIKQNKNPLLVLNKATPNILLAFACLISINKNEFDYEKPKIGHSLEPCATMYNDESESILEDMHNTRFDGYNGWKNSTLKLEPETEIENDTDDNDSESEKQTNEIKKLLGKQPQVLHSAILKLYATQQTGMFSNAIEELIVAAREMEKVNTII